MARRLATYLTEISVSLHGSNAERHDRAVGRTGAWRETMAAIARLQSCGLAVHVIIVLTPATLPDMEQLLQLCHQLQVRSLSFLGLMEVKGRISRLLSTEDRCVAGRLIGEQRRKWSGSLAINTKRVALQAPLGSCAAGQSMLGVDASGRLVPCILLAGMKCPWPSLLTASFTACLMEVRRLWAENGPNASVECAACQQRATCGKGCPGAGVVATGHATVDPLRPQLTPTS